MLTCYFLQFYEATNVNRQAYSMKRILVHNPKNDYENYKQIVS